MVIVPFYIIMLRVSLSPSPLPSGERIEERGLYDFVFWSFEFF
jgi:hypothetical protein